MFDFSREALISMLLSLPAILFCLSIHELAHGWVANKLGDPTARNLGRLTLNPLKHIDPFGFIALLLVRFGWAKPVPINMRYFKKPKRDMALSALAGPVANLLSAFVFSFVYCLAIKLMDGIVIDGRIYFLSLDQTNEYLLDILSCFVFINISLALFNLIPIPPLDGSHILDAFLPRRAYIAYHRYEQYISLALMAVLIFTDYISDLLSNGVFYILDIFMYLPEKVFF